MWPNWFDRTEWNYERLSALPTLAVGQIDDLKYEGTHNSTDYRVWLSRCGIEDGETWEHTGSLEILNDGKWTIAMTWNADDTLECSSYQGYGFKVSRG